MTTYYVGPGGNDAQDGLSWANRFLTLSQVESVVAAGDTVYLGPGTYTGSGLGGSFATGAAGSAGSPITYSGDWDGSHTDGVGGPVRLAVGSGYAQIDHAYRTFRGLWWTGSAGGSGVVATAPNLALDACVFSGAGINDESLYLRDASGTIHDITVQRCLFFGGGGTLLNARDPAVTRSDTNILVENCILLATGGNGNMLISVERIGGVVVRNCTLIGGTYGVRAASLAAGQSVTINNCILAYGRYGVYASAAGEISEDHNRFHGWQTNRTNTSSGANSSDGAPLFDPRWFFALTLGAGTLASPFDLAAGSPLVEASSGTTPPATDARGTSQQGSFREWGPLEYDAGLVVEAASGGGGRRVRMRVHGI